MIEKKAVCQTYSVYGYCPKIETCSKSHDIHLIIQTELNSESRKKKKRSNENKSEDVNTPEIEGHEISQVVLNQSHSAGLDAFMTGYVMLNYVNKFTTFCILNENESAGIVNFSEIDKLESQFRNNIYLAGKDYPLVVAKSNFVSTSIGHREKQSLKCQTSDK